MRTPDEGRRRRRHRALRDEALRMAGEILAYCEADGPAEPGWPEIEWQADVNRQIRELRDRLLRQGEYAR